MLNEVDGWHIAAKIRMARQIRKGTVLILEGHTDAKVFNRFIDTNLSEITVSFGKENALKALDLLEEEGAAGIVALVDADFDNVCRKVYSLENLYLTDFHDLDLTIFASIACDRYVAEHADRVKLQENFRGDTRAVRDRVVGASLPIALCKLASERQGLGLSFKGLKLEALFNVEDLSIDHEALQMELISRSRTRCSLIQLKAYIAIEIAEKHEPYQMASGHDVATILGLALRKLIASRRDVHTWGSEIEAGLRLAFDWEALKTTAIYKNLKAWEANNHPYRIFREASI